MVTHQSETQKKLTQEKKQLLERYWDKQVTVPKGPTMLTREKNTETIIERKKREYQELLKAKDEAPLK